LAHEVKNIKHDLQLNGFPPKLINSVISNTGGKNRLRNDVEPIGSVVIPYEKGIFGKFKRIGNRYNIRTIFKTNYTIRNTLMKTRPMSYPQLTAYCIYKIPCECGRSYVGEIDRHLSVRIRENKFNLKNGRLDKSKLDQHAFEEGHQISWNEAKILKIEVNSKHRKYKESVHIACMENPISQTSLEFSHLDPTVQGGGQYPTERELPLALSLLVRYFLFLFSP
jgi:hypothetical protein